MARSLSPPGSESCTHAKKIEDLSASDPQTLLAKVYSKRSLDAFISLLLSGAWQGLDRTATVRFCEAPHAPLKAGAQRASPLLGFRGSGLSLTEIKVFVTNEGIFLHSGVLNFLASGISGAYE